MVSKCIKMNFKQRHKIQCIYNSCVSFYRKRSEVKEQVFVGSLGFLMIFIETNP